jgi:hypothetical protein
MFFGLMPNHDFGTIQVISLRTNRGGTIYIYYDTFGNPGACRMVKYREGHAAESVRNIKEMLVDDESI